MIGLSRFLGDQLVRLNQANGDDRLWLGLLGLLLTILVVGFGVCAARNAPSRSHCNDARLLGGRMSRRRPVIAISLLLLLATPNQPLLPLIVGVVSALGLLLGGCILADLVRS